MAKDTLKAFLLAMMAVMIVVVHTKESDEYLSDSEGQLAETTASMNKKNETHAQLKGHQELPTTCERGMGDEVTKSYPRYVIMSHDGPKKQILCDTHTDGGGWIVFLRRATGDVNFYRDWTSYREGFGSLTGDFWMGNEALYNLTDKDPYDLRIDMRMDNGREVFAWYPDFRIEDESNKYRIQFGSYSGTAGDGMTYHNKMFFSTFDRDNDGHPSSCAVLRHGAWWYKDCDYVRLTAEWAATEIKLAAWGDGRSRHQVSFAEMKMRRIQLV